MKMRSALSTLAYVASLATLGIAAIHLSQALALYSPLAADHLGPRAPRFTQSVITLAPKLPFMLAGAGLLSLVAVAISRFRHRALETRTFVLTFSATFNFAVAASFPSVFYVGYFVVPKAANAF